MLKGLFLLFAAFSLFACNNSSSRKTKNIVELTTKMTVENPEKILLKTDNLPITNYISDLAKGKSFLLTKNNIISQPAFFNHIIYAVDSEGVVFAFCTKSKKHIWSNNINQKRRYQKYTGGGVEYHNEKLYVTNGSRFLTILDAKTGYEIVRKEFPDIIKAKPVTLNENLILIKTISNQLFAYDFVASKIIWQHEGTFEVLSSIYHPEPIIYKDQVIAIYSSGQIIALDSKTGTERWSLTLSDNNDIGLPNFEAFTVLTAPIIDEKYIYVASSTNKLLKIDILTGDIIWQTAASDIQSMSLLGGNIFITTNARQVAAINPVNGKIIWVADLINSLTKKQNQAAFSFQPFISKSIGNSDWVLNVVTDKGEIYRFESDRAGNLAINPNIGKIEENIVYSLNIDSQFYFITNKHIHLP